MRLILSPVRLPHLHIDPNRLPVLCYPHTAVLDCANGYQKENQQEVQGTEESCPQVASEAASPEAEACQKTAEEESHFA